MQHAIYFQLVVLFLLHGEVVQLIHFSILELLGQITNKNNNQPANLTRFFLCVILMVLETHLV
jgi:hypothetical protein